MLHVYGSDQLKINKNMIADILYYIILFICIQLNYINNFSTKTIDLSTFTGISIEINFGSVKSFGVTEFDHINFLHFTIGPIFIIYGIN